ncbi:hypothetical protein JCM10450v2_006108 [Rhodotorula kratochvilovae]
MNNPFAPAQQSEVSSAAHRFPDVLAQDPDLQRQQPQQQQQQQQYTGYQHPPPPQQQYLQPQATGFPPFGAGAGGGGAPSPQPYGGQYPSAGGAYGYQPQPQPSYPGADLDPYAHLGTLHQGASSPAPPQQNAQGAQGGTLLAVQQTQSHPRQYVNEARAQLMAWDEYAWKQLLSRLDALREAWESRLAGLSAAAGAGADPTNVDTLRRRAAEQVDGIHAAKMQLHEVQQGWRHSTDAASKARVREALNAGITSLPDYPAPVAPTELGGAFVHSAMKQGVMAQFGAGAGAQGGYGGMQPQQTGYQQSQQTGYGGMQPQPTGYGGAPGGYGGAPGGYQQPQQQTGYGYQQQPQQTGYGGAQGGYGGAQGGYGGAQGGYGGAQGVYPGQGYGGQGGYY